MERALDLGQAKESIQRNIAPYVGENMARASTQAHCERLGLNGVTITPQELGALLDRLAKAMRVFVGPQTTSELVRAIERDLLGGEKSP